MALTASGLPPDLAGLPIDLRIEAAALMAARLALQEAQRLGGGTDLSEAQVRAIADEAARKACDDFARRLGLEADDAEHARSLRSGLARLVRQERWRGDAVKTTRNAVVTGIVGGLIAAAFKWTPIARLFQ